MRLILGSQSPRRAEILHFFSIPFLQISSDFNEDDFPFAGNPGLHALYLSQNKANVLKNKYPQDIILTADTVVFCKDKLYNKPKSTDEAHRFLHELSGNWHSVFTGLTVSKGDEHYSAVEETKILLNPLSEKQIHLYCQACFFADKAGGYAIQRSGGIIVNQISGCYYNVMGLPINLLEKLLQRVEIDLWNFLKPF